MACVSLNNVIYNDISNIAKINEWTNYQLKMKQRAFSGDNFTSKIITAQMVKDDDDKNEQINLFIKLSNTTEKDREKFPIGDLFKREIQAYNIVLPELLKYQEEHGVHSSERLKIPKVYTENCEFMKEYLIMEDLLMCGYKPYGRANPLDYKHASAVLRSLANFHATSFAMNAKDKTRHDELTKHVSFEFNFPQTLAPALVNMMAKVVPHIECENRRNAITAFAKKYRIAMKKCLDAKLTEPYNVICHGDLWTNNIMMKYEDESIDPVFLDYQLIRYASPASDIMYLLYLTTEKSFRKKYFHKLCDEYYTTLDANLQLYGSNVDELYPRDVFDKHLTKMLPFGISLGLICTTLMFSKPGEERRIEEFLHDDLSHMSVGVSDSMIRRLEDFADEIISTSINFL